MIFRQSARARRRASSQRPAAAAGGNLRGDMRRHLRNSKRCRRPSPAQGGGPQRQSAEKEYLYQDKLILRFNHFHMSGGVLIDAPAKPGNSGSPIVDKDGKVVGIFTHSYGRWTEVYNPDATAAIGTRRPRRRRTSSGWRSAARSCGLQHRSPEAADHRGCGWGWGGGGGSFGCFPIAAW